MTAEYIIGVHKTPTATGDVSHVAIVNFQTNEVQLTVASISGFTFATKFKKRERAEKFAKLVPDAVLIQYYGGLVKSTKSSVTPIKPPINKHIPYRS